MNITRFDHLAHSISRRGTRKRAAVVWAADPTTREAVTRCIELGVIDAVFVGCREEIAADLRLAPLAEHYSVVDAANPDDAAEKAVALVHSGEADILVKGLINTDNLLRAVLNKVTGILRPGEVLTHITVAEIPAYPRLLVFTDAAVIPYPTPEQRQAQLRYALRVARSLNVECPRVAMVHCSEKVDPRHFPFTESYVQLKEMSARGDFGACVVDGPMDVKCALSKAALDKKGMVSEVDGQADIIIFPDIEAANTFYKTITLFGGASLAGMLCGTIAPVVLPSRGDSPESKTLSIMLAAMYA